MPDLTGEAEIALRRYRSETLQYAPLLGLAPLREWICNYLQVDGVKVSPEQIIIVNGAKHGLDLICRLLLDPGDCVAVTAPTYFTGIPIIRSYGVEFIEVPQDEEGMSVDTLHHQIERRKRENRPAPKLIYDIPDFHNPTGITMSKRRRLQLVELAASLGVAIVEDSPYREIRFTGAQVPSLKSLDTNDSVFQLGTFSKLMAPGLRIGWIAATQENIERIGRLKSDGGTCPLTQRIIYEYCAAGKLASHLDLVRKRYQEHRDTMIASLTSFTPKMRFKAPDGGYYIWARLPREMDSNLFAKQALARGVELFSGEQFFVGKFADYPVNSAAGSGYVRLSFSFASPAQIEAGIARLMDLLPNDRAVSRDKM
jgi:2-aminoadipate transaminase